MIRSFLGVSIFFFFQSTLVAAPAPRVKEKATELVSLLAQMQKQAKSNRVAIALWKWNAIQGLSSTKERKQFLSAIQKLVSGPSTPPLVQRLARRMLAAELQSMGNAEAAQAEWSRLGFVRDWWILGPFGNEGHKGFDAIYEPEQHLDLEKAEKTKDGMALWRQNPGSYPDGRIALQPLFLPSTNITTYALSVITLPQATPVWLHVGCDDGCKIWINQTLVVADPGEHPLSDDQHVLAVTLPAGNSLVLVKGVQTEGDFGFSMAVTDPRGQPVADLKTLGSIKEIQAALKSPLAPLGSIKAQENLSAWFEAEARRSPNNPEASAEAAFALVHGSTPDVRGQLADHWIQQSIDHLNPEDADIRLMLASTTDDQNLTRRLLEEILDRDPDHPQALTQLAQLLHIRTELTQALAYQRRALESNPRLLSAQLEQAELLFALELKGSALNLLDRLLLQFPDVPEVLVTAAQLFRQIGKTTEARELFDRLAALRTDDTLALRALYELAIQEGNVSESLTWMDRLLTTDPLRLDWWLERGDIVLRNQLPKDAIEFYRRALAICPQYQPAWVREGVAWQSLDKTQEALRCWRQALVLSPQDLDIRKHIEFLEPDREAFYQPWAKDSQKTRNPGVEILAGTSTSVHAIRLLDLSVVKLHPNGMTSRYHQELIRIQGPPGEERSYTFHLEYSPDRQQLQVLKNQVTHPDGRTDSNPTVNDFSLSEPWYNLYYDVHSYEVVLPSVVSGDLLEFSYVLDDVGSQSMLGDYFGDMAPFQFSEPAKQVTYVLLAPVDRPIYFQAPDHVTHQQAPSPSGGVIHTWEAENQRAVENESNMPGFTDSFSFLHVSTHSDWAMLSQWYHGLISDQLIAGPHVKQMAKSLVSGVEDPQDKIRAIYRFATDNIRYVGLEFGIHSYVPYSVSESLERKFGDCKDKASLLVSLYREVGIPAYLALVRMNRLGRLPSFPASLAAFNHAICYLPQQNLWLDATAPLYDITDLPPQDQGTLALIVQDQGGRLIETPITSPEQNKTEIRFNIQPTTDQQAAVDSQVTVSGIMAPPLRSKFMDNTEREDALEKTVNELFPGARIRSSHIENLNRPDLPLITEIQFEVPHWGSITDSALEVPALGKDTNYQTVFAPFQTRGHDLLLPPPWLVEWTVRFTPPAGFQLAKVLQKQQILKPFGQAELSCRVDADQVEVHASFRVSATRITQSQYSEFRAFVGQVDRLFGQRLHFSGVPNAAD